MSTKRRNAAELLLAEVFKLAAGDCKSGCGDPRCSNLKRIRGVIKEYERAHGLRKVNS